MAVAQKKEYEGSNWKEYSSFEFHWLEILLTQSRVGGRSIMSRQDILALLRKYNIRFSGENWEETVPQSEMGNVLINDIPKEKLLPSVQECLTSRYPEKLSFYEAHQIYSNLSSRSILELAQLYLKISQNEGLREMVEDSVLNKSRRVTELQKEDIIFFILEELYHFARSEVKKWIENNYSGLLGYYQHKRRPVGAS
jgi:hypothetical protein